MGYTYPPAPSKVTQGGTAREISIFLKSPNLVTRRAYDVTQERFLSDYLLTERATAVGGSIELENGDEIQYLDDDPQSIAPGAEFPLTKGGEGTIQTVRTVKWGLDVEVTDEAISRRLINPVNRAFAKLGNNMVRYVDGVALAIIAARITSVPSNSVAASGSWRGDGTQSGNLAAVNHMVADLLGAKAAREEANVGFAYDYDTVILRPTQLAFITSTLIQSGALPREAGNPLSTGVVPNIMGLNFATSTHVPFTDPFFVDRAQLGGIATENIESPGYGTQSPIPGGIPIEAKAIRDDKRELWTLRARRVEVPFVLDAKAGYRITGTGL